MNIISWLLALSIMILLMVEAVAFQRVTICRQEAWRKSVELKTRTLLTESKPYARDWHLGCRIYLERNQDEIIWQRLPNLKRHSFSLTLMGKL
jgi:hypothetical protein